MNKTRNKIILTLCIVVIISSVILGAFRIYEHREREAERRISETYLRVNILQHAPYNSYPTARLDGRYRPLTEYITFSSSEWGICVPTYLFLKFYERETGNTFTYEALIDYFSQEFEPDGSLRLYNNGNHPEIQALVEWRWELGSWQEFGEYLGRIGDIFTVYQFSNESFSGILLHHLSPQMLDALARAEADPDYVLDLTSLQRAGY